MKLNSLLTLAAVLTTALGPTAWARGDVRSFSAPHVSAPTRSAPAHVAATRSFAGARSFAAPRSFAPQRSFAAPRSFAGTSVYRANNFQRFTPQRVAPAATNRSFAFAGHTATSPAARSYYYNNNAAVTNRFAAGNNRFAAAPSTVSRNWDHRRQYEWNHHHYRWGGNSWIVLDGYPYAYGYGYGYGGYPYGYYGDTDPAYADNDAVDAQPANAPDTTPDSLGADVQEALANQGYYRGPVDGDIGPQTRSAIAAYQRDHRLGVTGMINTPLLDSLGLQ